MEKLVIGLVVLATVVGCGNKDGGASADGSAKPGATSAANEPFGIAECDDYFKKWDDCAAKNPAVKAVMSESVKQNRELWKTMASSPDAKAKLPEACKAASTSLGDSCK